MTDITRPIAGIENRTPLEVFDIMVERIRRTPPPRSQMVEADIRWIEWAGGEFLPVPHELRVTVLLRDGSIEGPAPARDFGGDESCWRHRGADGDIVAYTSDLLFAAPPQSHLMGHPDQTSPMTVGPEVFFDDEENRS